MKEKLGRECLNSQEIAPKKSFKRKFKIFCKVPIPAWLSLRFSYDIGYATIATFAAIF